MSIASLSGFPLGEGLTWLINDLVVWEPGSGHLSIFLP